MYHDTPVKDLTPAMVQVELDRITAEYREEANALRSQKRVLEARAKQSPAPPEEVAAPPEEVSHVDLAKASKTRRDLFVARLKRVRTLKALAAIMDEVPDSVAIGDLYPDDMAQVTDAAGLKEAEIKAEDS